MVQVGEEHLALAMLRMAEMEKCVIEGAGAAGLAALLSGRLPELRGRRVVTLLTGGNIDPLAHSRVIERGLAADGRIYRFDALISDRPGGLAHLSALLAEAGSNVTEIVHNRTFAGPDLSRVHVLCTVETRDRAHIGEIQQRLADNGVELVHGVTGATDEIVPRNACVLVVRRCCGAFGRGEGGGRRQGLLNLENCGANDPARHHLRPSPKAPHYKNASALPRLSSLRVVSARSLPPRPSRSGPSWSSSHFLRSRPPA